MKPSHTPEIRDKLPGVDLTAFSCMSLPAAACGAISFHQSLSDVPINTELIELMVKQRSAG